MAEQKLTAEEQLRSSIEDVISLAKKLQPICTTTQEMIEVCELALTNDAQLKMLMREASQGKR